MNSIRLVLAVVLFSAMQYVCPLSEAQENSPESNPPIRVSVDRVNVGAIVTDSRGRFVDGLRREEFHVYDNGIEQPLAGFAAIEEPAQVLLLIEAGPGVYLLENGHVWAANALLDGLSPDDRVAVVKYAEAPEALLDFTADKKAAAAALGELRFNLGFGTLNLSSSISKVLEWLKNVRGKKTIVLLATGLDTSAPKEMAAALQQLKTGDVLLLAVSLSGGLENPQARNKKKTPKKNYTEVAQEFEQAEQLLRQLAESTGGRAYFPRNRDEFNAGYAEIAQLVRHEYSLSFAPPALDGSVHAIEVRVSNPQASGPNGVVATYRVDHRQAYEAVAPR